jgi:hypothetical protein
MKLESWHTSADKARWKLVRTDTLTDVEGDIVSADEADGKFCVQVGDDLRSFDLGPGGIRIIRRSGAS